MNITEKQEWIEYYRTLWYDSDYDNYLNNGSRCKPMKAASSHDGINMKFLKYRRYHTPGCCTCTAYLKARTVPQKCQEANVISLYEKGGRQKCDNHRGITLLTAAYTLY